MIISSCEGTVADRAYEMWEMIGGVEGLAKMRIMPTLMCACCVCRGAGILMKLVIVTERIRLEAAVVRRAVSAGISIGRWIL